MIREIKSLISQKIPPTCDFWFIDLNTPSVNLKAAFSVDIPFLKPYRSVIGMLLACRSWLSPSKAEAQTAVFKDPVSTAL